MKLFKSKKNKPMKKLINILLIGPPGAGKGTLTQLLEKKMKYQKVVCGDIFRDHIKNKTKIGRKFISYIDRGQLAPDKVVNKMMEKEFIEKIVKNKNISDKKNVIIWDGYPRNIAQAQYFDAFLAKVDFKLDYVIWINVDLEIIIKRITNRLTCPNCHLIFNSLTNPPKKENVCDDCQSDLSQRSDDKKHLIQVRYEEFEKETKPLWNYYQKKNIIKKMDGSLNINEIFKECSKIGKNE